MNNHQTKKIMTHNSSVARFYTRRTKGRRTNQVLLVRRDQGGSKHGRRTLGISCEDCYAREILKLETNYYDRMNENCHISASTAPRHLKIGKERAYTMIYHKMNLCLSRSNYISKNMAWNRDEALWWALSQNFSKLIAIKNWFSGHYISTQAEAGFSFFKKEGL